MQPMRLDPAVLAPPRPDVVVFDFDGTLARLTIDFGAMRRAVIACLEASGVPEFARSDRHVLEMIEDACAALPAEASAELRRRCDAEVERIEVSAARSGGLLPGVREALDGLRSHGLGVGIITRNCRQAVLTSAPDILERVDALVARGDTPFVKPDPAHVRACVELLGASDGRIAVVGDHPMDMTTARAGGWRGFGVLCGAGNVESLLDAGAEAVFGSAPAFAGALLGTEARE